jgi:cation diffusion facilitator CzcD-associated flavoprotein CzcO
VVVVGLANTGGDIAVDVTKTAKKVYISHRSGVRLVSSVTKRDQPQRLISIFSFADATRLSTT